MPGPRTPFETLAQSFHIHVAAKPRRVHFRRLGSEKPVHARFADFFYVLVERPRIFRKILLGPELFWIHKKGSDYRRTILLCTLYERQMPIMQRAHRRHQPHDASLGTRLPRVLFHPGDGPDYFHGKESDETTRCLPAHARDKNASGRSGSAARQAAAAASSPVRGGTCRD